MKNILIINIPFLFMIVLLTLTIISDLCLISYTIIKEFTLKQIRHPDLFKTFILWFLLLLLWNLGQLLELLYGKQEILSFLKYLAMCFSSFVWFLLITEFISHKSIQRIKNIKNIIIISTIPTILCLTVLFTQNNNIFNNSKDITHGIIFAVHVFFYVLYCILILFLMIGCHYKFSSTIILLSFFSPVIFSFIQTFGVIKFNVIGTDFIRKDFDFSSVGLYFSSFIITIGFLRYKLIEVKPIAYKEIYDNMQEAVTVIDEKGYIHLANKSFKNMFMDDKKLSINQKPIIPYLNNVISHKTHILDSISNNKPFEFISEDIIYKKKPSQFYIMDIKPLMDDDEYIGKIISFKNVTKYKGLLEQNNKKMLEMNTIYKELKKKNIENKNANEKLREYSLKAGELAAEKERSRIVNSMQTTLSYSISSIVSMIEMARYSLKHQPEKVDQLIDMAMDNARDTLKDIRLALKGLFNEVDKNNNLLFLLEKLSRIFEEYGLNIELSVDEAFKSIKIKHSKLLFKICHDAILHSYVNKNANILHMVMRKKDNNAILFIFDNGVNGGINIENHGLSNSIISEIEDLGGHIDFNMNDIGTYLRINIAI